MEDKFLRFLINPYLKKLDVTSDCFQNPHIIIEQLKKVGSNIISLNMTEREFPEKVIIELVSLVPNVEELNISNTESTDKVLVNIGKHCSQLRTLDMCFCKITEEGLISLCMKDENGKIKPNYLLKYLCISATGIKENGVIFALTHFPSLEELDHESAGKAIYEACRSKYLDGTLNDAKKYNLTKLHVDGFQFPFPVANTESFIFMADVLQVCSVVCPRVEYLYLVDIANQEEVLACCNFTRLKDIVLYSKHSVDYSPLLERNVHSLLQITVGSGVVSLEVLCKFYPKLESLILQFIAFEKMAGSPKNYAKTALFPRMISLTLEGMEFVDDVAETTVFLLNCSPVLEYLYLPYCRCLSENQFITSVLKCECIKSLRKLVFRFSDINISSVLKFLEVTQNLERLDIKDCDFISRTEYQRILKILQTQNRAVEVTWGNISAGYESNYKV